MHLRETELAGDTTLAQICEVVQLRCAAGAGQGPQPRLDQDALLSQLQSALCARVACGGGVLVERNRVDDDPSAVCRAGEAEGLRAVPQVAPDLTDNRRDRVGVNEEPRAAS